MKKEIARTSLWFFVVLGVSAIFVAARLHPFSVRPILSPAPEPIPASYFGMTLHNFQKTPWPAIPFSALRTWDTGVGWADIEQAPNSYTWSKLDALIAVAQSKGVDLVYTFGLTPRWASASPEAATPYGPGRCAPPANIEAWENFVRAIVTHAAGKIRFWEIWNEPQNQDFYCGSVSQMVELQRRAYQTINSIDPAAKVLTPSPVNALGPTWMSRFLAAGGGKYADIMAFHGYLDPAANAEAITSIIAKFKAVFAEYGQGAKPVWDTEANGGENFSLSDPDGEAALLAKFYLLHWSAGINRLFWYGYDNPHWGTLWDSKIGLRKPGIAYREVHQWLQGATMDMPCALTNEVWTCNLVRENGYRAMVIWSSSKVTSRISVPVEYRHYRDLDGNMQNIIDGGAPISYKPIMVETTTAF